MPARKNTPLTAVPLDHPVNDRITHEIVTVTPETAAKWLGQNHGNRNVRILKVKAYARDMRNGKWMTSGDSIKFDWNGRLIDGQHRLEAVIESGATVRILVARGLDPRVQDVLDVNVRRSNADALRFNGFEHNQDTIAAIAKIANARELGFLRIATSSHIPELTNAEVIEWAEAHPEALNAAALARRTARGIGATPSALGYAIWRLEQIDPLDATEFILSMAEARTNGSGDPRLTLLRTFNRLKQDGRKLTPALQLRYIFAAWNAWREGRTLSKFAGHKTTTPNSGTQGVAIPEPK